MVEAWKSVIPEPDNDLDGVNDNLALAQLKKMQKGDLYVNQVLNDLKERLSQEKLGLAEMQKIYDESQEPGIRSFLKNEIKLRSQEQDLSLKKHQVIDSFKSVFNEMGTDELRDLRDSLRLELGIVQDDSELGYKLLALDLVLGKKEKTKSTPDKIFILNYEKELHNFEMFQLKLKEIIKRFETKLNGLKNDKNQGKGFWSKLFKKENNIDNLSDYYKESLLEPLRNDLVLLYREYILSQESKTKKVDELLRDPSEKESIDYTKIFDLKTNHLFNVFNFVIHKENAAPELLKGVNINEVKEFWQSIMKDGLDVNNLNAMDFSSNLPTLLKTYKKSDWGDVILTSVSIWYLNKNKFIAKDFLKYKQLKLNEIKKNQIASEEDAKRKGFASYRDMLKFDSQANKLLEQERNRELIEEGVRPLSRDLHRENEVYIKSDLESILNLEKELGIYNI